MLRDRLVVGINDAALQRRLLSEPRLNLKKATEIALAHETAIKDSKAIQDGNGTPQPVNPIFNPQRPQSSGTIGTSKPCYHCGKSNHKATVGNPITRLLYAIIKKLFVITARRKDT